MLMNIFYRNKLKTIQCRRLETKRHSDRNGDFGFRRKAQVRTNSLFNFSTNAPIAPMLILTNHPKSGKIIMALSISD